eukprot:1157096-Pelagomonas_calceolata.AAC.3
MRIVAELDWIHPRWACFLQPSLSVQGYGDTYAGSTQLQPGGAVGFLGGSKARRMIWGPPICVHRYIVECCAVCIAACNGHVCGHCGRVGHRCMQYVPPLSEAASASITQSIMYSRTKASHQLLCTKAPAPVQRKLTCRYVQNHSSTCRAEQQTSIDDSNSGKLCITIYIINTEKQNHRDNSLSVGAQQLNSIEVSFSVATKRRTCS